MAPYIPSVIGSDAVAWPVLERQPAKGNAPARTYLRIGWRVTESNPVARNREIRHINVGNVNTLGDLPAFIAALMPTVNAAYLQGAGPTKSMVNQLRAAALDRVRADAAGEDTAEADAFEAALVPQLVADAATSRQTAEAEAEAGLARAGNLTDVPADVAVTS